MATKVDPKTTSTNVEPKPKKSRILIIVLALLIILAGGGAGAWYFLDQKATVQPAKAAHVEAKPPVFLPMEAFTVNLLAENGEQFLQTSFTLQVLDQAQVDLIKLYMPHVRSRILLLLSSKKASEILTVEGKTKLAEEIINIFKQPFTPQGPTVKVSSVLFTSFVVQ
ncbi:flagellar basal body-associated protein FliL [Herminiimonas sp. NPDC097707]|uniref:flagellar basal body-associated protein FliL n=1 Tax=Herminiimonas sp. NPDC097707 TaxID=3364007 RepID=UPI00383BF226